MFGTIGIFDTRNMNPVQVRRGVVDGRLHMDPDRVHAHHCIDDTAG